LKMKRPQVRSYFAPQIEDMYVKLKWMAIRRTCARPCCIPTLQL
jgi:hypothetical protein